MNFHSISPTTTAGLPFGPKALVHYCVHFTFKRTHENIFLIHFWVKHFWTVGTIYFRSTSERRMHTNEITALACMWNVFFPCISNSHTKIWGCLGVKWCLWSFGRKWCHYWKEARAQLSVFPSKERGQKWRLWDIYPLDFYSLWRIYLVKFPILVSFQLLSLKL